MLAFIPFAPCANLQPKRLNWQPLKNVNQVENTIFQNLASENVEGKTLVNFKILNANFAKTQEEIKAEKELKEKKRQA